MHVCVPEQAAQEHIEPAQTRANVRQASTAPWSNTCGGILNQNNDKAACAYKGRAVWRQIGTAPKTRWRLRPALSQIVESRVGKCVGGNAPRLAFRCNAHQYTSVAWHYPCSSSDRTMVDLETSQQRHCSLSYLLLGYVTAFAGQQHCTLRINSSCSHGIHMRFMRRQAYCLKRCRCSMRIGRPCPSADRVGVSAPSTSAVSGALLLPCEWEGMRKWLCTAVIQTSSHANATH